MQIPLPPGYRQLVPLDRQQHAGRGLVQNRSWAAPLTGIYLCAAEFIQASRHYPIVFVPAGDDCVPVAVTGLEPERNLFVDDAGEWAREAYIPAFVRRWPLYGVRLEGEGQPTGKLLICVDESGLAVSGAPLFDARGEPASAYHEAEALVREMEAARPATETLCRELRALELLEAFEAHAVPKQGDGRQVRGMLRVNEARLNALPAETVQRLMQAGMLSRIYAHLMSLDNFKFLLDRVAARSRSVRPLS